MPINSYVYITSGAWPLAERQVSVYVSTLAGSSATHNINISVEPISDVLQRGTLRPRQRAATAIAALIMYQHTQAGDIVGVGVRDLEVVDLEFASAPPDRLHTGDRAVLRQQRAALPQLARHRPALAYDPERVLRLRRERLAPDADVDHLGEGAHEGACSLPMLRLCIVADETVELFF